MGVWIAMNQLKLKNSIEVASNIAVVVVALVFLVSFARSSFLPMPQHLVLQSGLQKGSQFPQLPGVDFSRSQKTLLVAMDSKCDSCKESLPFLKNLAGSFSGRSDARMIAVFPSAEEEAKRYARQNQLNMDTIFGLDFKMLHLKAIPAMILIDSSGTVIDFWLGKPSEDTEKQIVNSL